MRFSIPAVAFATALISPSQDADARVLSSNSGLFGIHKGLFEHRKNGSIGVRAHPATTMPLSMSILRGGANDEEDDPANSSDVEAILYLPGLLEASVSGKWDITEADKDCTILITASKAKELNVKSGDVVGIIGRRRRASYAFIKISKGKKGTVQISHNLASNLRVRDTDKVKIVPLDSNNQEDFSAEASGDMALLATTPTTALSVTFSPVKDSLHSLELSEGGDELSEAEIMERFVKPYLDLENASENGSGIVLKRGHTLVLRDANKMTLEFTLSHIEVDSDATDQGEGDEEKAIGALVGSSTEVVIGSSIPRTEVGLGYDSVGGCEKAVKLMRELVELPLRFPELWTTAGVPTPKGVLLHGPPGCGKTLIANALMEETGAHVVTINGPEIMARKGG